MPIGKSLRFWALPTLLLVLMAPAWAQPGKAPQIVAVKATTSGKAASGAKITLNVALTIKAPFHVNANPATEAFLIPTTITIQPTTGMKAGKPIYPAGVKKKFGFSPKPLSVYEGTVTVRVPLTIDKTAPKQIKGQVRYQACNDQECLMPQIIPFTASLDGESGRAVSSGIGAAGTAVAASGSGASENAASWQQRLQSAPLWLQLAIAFLGGLALNLTPCVFPMIPITVGYFGAQSEGRIGKTFSLALLYVLGLAMVYSALGVSAALTGNLFGSAMQSPVVIGIVAVVLGLLALSSLGVFTIQPPQFLLQRSGAKKGALGALGMGALLGVVAAPCVGPFVAALLAYVGLTQNVGLGFILFFTLSLGLGLPYLFLGAFSGSIKSLPRSGPWLERLKKLFAIPLLAAAFYFGYLAIKPAPVEGASGDFAKTLQQQYKVQGLPVLVFLDESGKERADLRAGEELTREAMIQKLAQVKNGAATLAADSGAQPGAEGKWAHATKEAIEAARRNHQPIVLDFRADWCLPCRKIESTIFSQPDVQRAATGVTLLQVDLT